MIRSQGAGSDKMSMTRAWILIILLSLSLLPGHSAAEEIVWHPYDEGMTLASSSGKMVMIYFHSDSCYWCREMSSKTFSDQGVIDLSSNFVCISVMEDRELASRYHVRSYPTIIFLDPEGREVFRLIGYRDPPRFKDEIRAILEGRIPSDGAPSPGCSLLVTLGVIGILWLYLRR